MSILRRRSTSPAAAPPLEDENLLSEILLRLPPDPSSLPRASSVCKRWRHLVSDPRFTRRFRLHHRRNPPLLGFFTYGCTFQPTLEAPNCVPPGRFSLQQDRSDLSYFKCLGCRHGLVLIWDWKRYQALVWDPVTSDQHRIALPPRFGDDENIIRGTVLRSAGDVHFQFQVVLVASSDDDGLHDRVRGCVYSSETGLWGNPISPPIPFTSYLSEIPAVLVGDSLYWILIGEFPGILEFDLPRQSLTVIPLPMDMFDKEWETLVMPAEGGGLGLLHVSQKDFIAQLWKRKTDCDLVASWELGRTIELEKLLSLNLEEVKFLRILGFAECNKVVLLWTPVGIFMVEFESLQFKKASEDPNLFLGVPFESVYTAGNSMILHCAYTKSIIRRLVDGM